MNTLENEDIETDCLLEAIFKKYGYDFRHYAKAHIKRRIRHFLSNTNPTTPGELLPVILRDKQLFSKLLYAITINVTEMFRDPLFYATFRKIVCPSLHTFPHFKVWHAGCASGEEVYSMAILLKEEKLYKKAILYATDIDSTSLKRAKTGIYPIDDIKLYIQNYQNSGAKNDFSEYYTAKYKDVIMRKSLRDKITFAEHNLASDTSFGEMNVIICRNVMIYFNKTLREKVLRLFYDSLCYGGFLCIGTKESLRFSEIENGFEEVDAKNRIYRKIYPKN